MKIYGITGAEYESMVAQQGGACAICSKPEVERHQGGKLKSLVVDHNHSTGLIRGLLCSVCNKAIGLLDDDRSRLLAAVAYLDRYQPQLKMVK